MPRMLRKLQKTSGFSALSPSRRIDVKLTKRQLSIKLYVSDTTIYLWKKNKLSPSLRQIPKIIGFLIRDPIEKENENLAEKIKHYRRVHGLSQKKLAKQFGIDISTLAGWESEKHQPLKRLLDKMNLLLKSSEKKDSFSDH